MKQILTLITLTLLTQSCTVNDANDIHDLAAESWELISIENTSSTEINDDPTIYELLTLQNDSIFTRTRKTSSNTWVLDGTYSYMTANDTKYLVFRYQTKNDLIGNCSNNQNEVFVFEPNGDISNTWFECGGPRLKYRKTE